MMKIYRLHPTMHLRRPNLPTVLPKTLVQMDVLLRGELQKHVNAAGREK